MIRVVVVDDQPLVRAGISMLLQAEDGIEVVAEAGDGREAVAVTHTTRPDIVVMDVRMPGMDGVEATRRIVADTDADRLTRVLALTTFQEDEVVYAVLRAGASGFLLKQAAPADLVTAIRRVAGGDAWLDPAVTGAVIAALANMAGTSRSAAEFVAALTPREQEVLKLIAEGLSNAEIVDLLVVSEATVKTHVARILMKTGSRDRAQLVARAHQVGVV